MNKYIGISKSIGVVSSNISNLDIRYGPYNNIQEAVSELPEELRGIGLTIGILSIENGIEVINEYWWKEGTSDNELVKKVWEFKGLSKKEKDELKLKFEDLTPSDKLELKGDTGEQGPKGDKGDKGEKGIPGDPGSYIGFEIDENMNLVMSSPDNYYGPEFVLENGELKVII